MVKKRATGYLLQDIGLVLLLLCIGILSVTVGNARNEEQMEFFVMLMASFLAVLLAGFKFNSLSIVTAGFSVVAYTAYKLYFWFAYSEQIVPLRIVWVAAPLLAVAAMQLFVYGNKQTELENDVLREQVEELVLINPLTGLYNLRSLYIDMKKQIAYAERNQISLSLMIIKLRYEPELRNVLSRRSYEAVLQKTADIVVDAVRLEDRTYSIDNQGSVGVILTCDQAGSEFVKKRIKARIENPESFQGIVNSAIRVEVRIACLQYQEENHGSDLVDFKQKVESELQYDV